MRFAKTLFGIVAAIGVVIMFFAAVDADFRKGETCQCFFVGNCTYDENGVGYRYHYCRGSCAAYSSWWVDTKCNQPKIMPLPQPPS